MKRVLIIDDEAAFTTIVKLALEMKEGYEVCVENDSRLAVDVARRFKPDLILLDVVMEEVDGGEVHAKFKADRGLKHIPIIFLTGIVRQEEVKKRSGKIGGARYLAKPVDADELINVIKQNFSR